MRIETKQFGEITIDEDKIIKMPKGLPGFPGLTRYILLEHEDIHPFISLQSVDEETLAFYLIDPYLFKSDYSVDCESYIEDLKWEKNDRDSIFIYVILNVADEDPKKITANLLGPLLINTAKNQAVQMLISDGNYSHKYFVFADNKKNKGVDSK